MTTLYITQSPTVYLTPGKVAAANRVLLKRTARVCAKAEGYNAIAIVDAGGFLIEQVSTAQDIVEKRYVTGYRVRVVSASSGVRCDSEEFQARAEMFGTVIKKAPEGLTVHVPHPRELFDLRGDNHFVILNIEVARANQ